MVLVGHGAPPKGFPDDKVAEYIRLEKRVRAGDKSAEKRLEEIEKELMEWPRTKENDPYWFYLNELAETLKREGGYKEVIPAFNEFCPPNVEQAIERALKLKPDIIVVVPTMMVKGGEHSEVEIKESVEKARESYPDIRIVYAWPFDTRELASFISEHVNKFITKG